MRQQRINSGKNFSSLLNKPVDVSSRIKLQENDLQIRASVSQRSFVQGVAPLLLGIFFASVCIALIDVLSEGIRAEFWVPSILLSIVAFKFKKLSFLLPLALYSSFISAVILRSYVASNLFMALLLSFFIVVILNIMLRSFIEMLSFWFFKKTIVVLSDSQLEICHQLMPFIARQESILLTNIKKITYGDAIKLEGEEIDLSLAKNMSAALRQWLVVFLYKEINKRQKGIEHCLDKIFL
ncbi:hypothetical protein [Candidatus Uabimicrobium amorphum]|uniref:Uncharacterized protein n=1 Tax=Uabimicrobium amorphum TaxID=2596890 RepID=A0A5S9IUG4_UABAM|nr:hypothetical protein [Candidatus Uabimicrobium amorphum]BBM86835.1 hypothetical protein UABAM_05228 [Candidatus Uabimicrobium amorphum]